MAKETELETLFYSIEARTQHLKPQIEVAKRIIDDVAKRPVEIPVSLNIEPVESGSKRVKRALSEMDGATKKVSTSSRAAHASIAGVGTATQSTAESATKAAASTMSFAESMRGLAAAAVVVQAIGLAKESIAIADAYTNIRSRLTLVTDGTANFAKVQSGLFDVAQATRTEFGSTVALYSSLARSTKTLGLSQTDLIAITKTVGQAFLISGAEASESAAAVRQLGQALGKGRLDGDEFNSIAENAPRLQQAVAESLGITIGQLRKYAEEGKLTAAIVTKALQESAAAIDNEASSVAVTVEGAMTQVRNSLLLAVGEFGHASGATAALAKAVSDLTKASDEAGSKTVSAATKWGYFADAVTESGKALRNILGLNNEIGESTPKMIERLRAGFSDAGDAIRRYLNAQKGIVESGAPELPKMTRTTIAPYTVPSASPVSAEYRKAAEAATLLRDRQRELSTALGFGADSIEEINARFDLKTKLMDIDAEASKANSKITKEQAEQLKALARETAAYEKVLRTVKSEKAADQIVSENKKRNDDIAKRDAKEVAELLDGVRIAHEKGAAAVKSDADAQAFELSIIGKTGTALFALQDARLQAATAAEYEAAGLDKLGAAQAADAYVIGEQTKRRLELVAAAKKYTQELNGKNPFSIPDDDEGLIANLVQARDIINEISDILGDAGGDFGAAVKQAANSLRVVAQGVEAAGKLNKDSSFGDKVGAALPIVGAAASAISFWADSTKRTAQAAHEAATALRELRVATQASLASFKLEAGGTDLDRTLAGLKAQFDAIYKGLVAAGGVDPNAPARTAHSIVPTAQDFADAEAAYKKLVQAAIDAAHKAAEQAEAEAKAAAVQKAQANASRILDDDIRAFGLKGRDALATTIASFISQFSELANVVDGLDLTTQNGLDALKARGQALLTQLKADGTISDDEQKILDSFFRIYDAAVDTFDSLAERVQRALSKLDDDNAIFGGDSRTQFGRSVDAAKGFNGALDAILSSVDLSETNGAENLRTQLRGLYTSLLVDGISDEEAVIVGLIRSLLGGLDNAVDEALQESEARNATLIADRAKTRTRADRTNAVTDAEGPDAFVNFLSSLAPAIANLFGEFNIRALTGINDAKDRLIRLNGTIDSLSDEQITTQFGMTRDELVDGILALDSSLDNLKQTALSAADAALSLANAQQDAMAQNQDDFLRTFGRDQEADIEASKQKTNKKLQAAKDLELSQAEIDKIIATGDQDIRNINKRYADQATAANPRTTADAARPTDDARTEYVASAVKSISSAQALRMTDGIYSLVGIGHSMDAKLGAILSTLVTGASLPRLITPALPQGAGGFGNSSAGSAPGINITINLSGPITGQTAGDAARQLANELLPYIDRGLARSLSSAANRSGNLLR